MSYKVFTNGSPLPASDLNDFLMKQSVMTFANATERDAALTAPTEGMCVYLENNNHFQIRIDGNWVTQNPINAQGDLIVGNASGQPSRLAIGTNGQVLQSNGTTATWATPAAAGAENWQELLSFATIPTGSTTASMTGFPSPFAKYLLVIDTVSSASASSQFTLRINSTSSGYEQYGVRLSNPTTYAATILGQGGANSSAIVLGNMSSNAGSSVSASFFISNANSTTNPSNKYFEVQGVGSASTGNGQGAEWGRGIWTNTSAVTSFQLLSGTGNIDGGSWKLYGSLN